MNAELVNDTLPVPKSSLDDLLRSRERALDLFRQALVLLAEAETEARAAAPIEPHAGMVYKTLDRNLYGLTSGAAYSIHEVINATDHGRDGTPRVSSGNDTEVLHGEGGVPDLFFRQHYQFTVNANGEITVDFNDIESTCS